MRYSFVLLTLLLCAFDPDNAIDERIRQKVENLPVFQTLNKEYEIFCIPSIREAYLKNEFNPFWSLEEKVNELVSIIEHCESEGLHPEDYHLTDILEIKKVNSNEFKANLDIICTDAFLLYCSHILSGKTNPETIDHEWHVIKTETNPVKYMYEINTRSIPDIITSLKPKNNNYVLLQERLKHFRDQSNEGISWKIQRGPIIRPDMIDDRIPQIREVLLFLKDYPEDQDMQNKTYDETLKQAVIRFQKRHGLEALGTIGDQTIEMLNILPEIRKDKSYLSQKNIFVYDKSGAKLNIDSIDWRKDKVLDFTYRQEPGKTNSLGAIKFIFPNKFNVYLHDTPAMELFEKTERAYSSGCIRVQNPLELAEFLLRDKPGYSRLELQKIVESSNTVTVILNKKPEVYLLYLTIWVDDTGKINFRKDIYNRDQRLYNALQEKPVYDVN